MINWPQKTIESWTQLQTELDAVPVGCIFRGQGNQQWPLAPSFNRLLPEGDETVALKLEEEMILRFRSEAHLHLPPSVMPPNSFRLDQLDTYLEWLMLMQHYGAPTRMLDWTLSPYVAVYFAVIVEWAADAAIWYFDPRPANKVIFQHYGKSTEESLDYADMSSDDIRLTAGDPMLYTAQKKMRTAREVAQQGVFTLTNRLLAHHQDVVDLICRDCTYGRLIIPQELKADFCRRLFSMNVTGATLFPGVEGICNSLHEYMRLATASV